MLQNYCLQEFFITGVLSNTIILQTNSNITQSIALLTVTQKEQLLQKYTSYKLHTPSFFQKSSDAKITEIMERIKSASILVHLHITIALHAKRAPFVPVCCVTIY